MRQTRMVRLTTVADRFHAKVIAARLGSEGVVTQLRGNVDGPYPMGDVHVYVEEDELPTAREILTADEIESAFDGDPMADDDPPQYAPHAPWIVLVALVVALAVFFVRSM